MGHYHSGGGNLHELGGAQWEYLEAMLSLAGAPVRKFREGGRRKPHHVHLRMLGAGDAVAWHEREMELDNLSDKLRIAQVLHADDALDSPNRQRRPPGHAP